MCNSNYNEWLLPYELWALVIEILIAQVAHRCPEHCAGQNESKAIKREMRTQVQGLWDGAVPSGLLEWQAALSPPHAAPFARIYSDFTSESPEQQESKRAWPVRVRIALLPLMTTVGPQTLHKGKHNTTSATFTQSHSSHGTNEVSSPGASHVLCGIYCCYFPVHCELFQSPSCLQY